jgi:hypothetical protein
MKKVFILGRALLIWAIGIAVLVLIACMSSCESKSGHPHLIENTKPERVVVIQETSITYKVQRIDKGIVDYITIPDYYLPGDTIQVTFN